MIALPQAFVDAMTGALPVAPRIPPVVRAIARTFLPGKRVPEPTAQEIRAVDRSLAAEKILIAADSMPRDVRDVSWAWENAAPRWAREDSTLAQVTTRAEA